MRKSGGRRRKPHPPMAVALGETNQLKRKLKAKAMAMATAKKKKKKAATPSSQPTPPATPQRYSPAQTARSTSRV